MIVRGKSRGFAEFLVLGGTFAAPLAQWVVFFLVARGGGSAQAGTFALLFAFSTPLVTAANWGLRNGYITLPNVSSFVDFLLVRVLGVVVAGLITVLFAVVLDLDLWMASAVIALKSADSMSDIWFGRWQRQQRLLPFGLVMILNGCITVGCALGFYLMKASGAIIVFGSSIGSLAAFAICIGLDAKTVVSWWSGSGRWLSGIGHRVSRLLRDCWQICAAQVLSGLVVNVPTWAVGFVGSKEDVGRFAAAGYMITVGSLVGSSLNSTVLGQYHSDMISGGSVSVKQRVKRGTVWLSFVGCIAVVFISVFGADLFGLIYGSQFSFSTLELVVVALAAMLNPGTYLMNAALLAVNLYGDQLSIVAAALVGSVVAAVVSAMVSVPGFLVGACSALVGSLVKFGLSGWRLGRIRRRAAPSLID